MKDCIFCKIINKEIPTTPVLDNEQVIVIKDINPKAPIHLLVIPKRHITSLAQEIFAAEKIYGVLLKTVTQVAREQGIDKSGFRVVINNGDDGGQEVKHLHLHILGGRQLGVGLG